MNKRNVQRISPRPFPKQQYKKLTYKIRLYLILPILIILIGGGIGGTYYYHNAVQHHTYQKVHRHEHVKRRPALKHTGHKAHIKPINVEQGEHLLGHWLKQLHYSDAKAPTVLTNYQKQNKNQDLKTSQQLNQLTHNSMNNQTKARQIRHLINKI